MVQKRMHPSDRFELYGYNETTRDFQARHERILSPEEISRIVNELARGVSFGNGNYLHLVSVMDSSALFAKDLGVALTERGCFVDDIPLYVSPNEENSSTLLVKPVHKRISKRHLLLVDSGLNHPHYDFLRHHLKSLGADRVRVVSFIGGFEKKAEYVGQNQDLDGLVGYGFGSHPKQHEITSLYRRRA